MRLKRLVACLIVFLGFHSIRAYGQVVATWTDSSGNWSDPANWSTLTVPNNGGGTTYSVTISPPSSASAAVTMDVLNVTVDSFGLGVNGSLNINTGDSLSLVSGGGNGGMLTNYGTFNNSGTFYNVLGTIANHVPLPTPSVVTS